MPLSSKSRRPTKFESFDPLSDASFVLNYLTKMTDEKLGHLPFWMVAPFNNPAYAQHSRSDDAELVASWYEGISALREMLETDEGEDVENALRKLLLTDDNWGDCGLRFPHARPWSEMVYVTFSETASVLSALNRMLERNPSDRVAEKRASELVRGLRSLVLEHTMRAPWSGPMEIEEPTYSFPSDVYLRDGGFDPTITTGVGESVLRNAMLIYPLVNRYQLKNDEVALDLATGLANHLVGMSHYFNYRMEFFGNVHAALMAAVGLGKLGRLTQQDRFVAKCKGIYDFVRRHSSAFGWIPEFMQWQLIADERCEACCIKDMIFCALELVDCGFPEYWDDAHRYWRNHLSESILRNASFVVDGEPAAKDERRIYGDIAQRIIGGVSGSSSPNGSQSGRFRFVAGCCAGSAPLGMLAAWRVLTETRRNIQTINFPVNKETALAEIEIGYPNDGVIRVRLKKNCRIVIRVYPWMPAPHEGTINGRPAGLERREDLVFFPQAEKGALLELRHDMKTRRVMEHVGGNDYFGIWRGPEMIDILPHGTGYRFYQRGVGVAKDYPAPLSEKVPQELEVVVEPPPMKETRLNRRKPPRA